MKQKKKEERVFKIQYYYIALAVLPFIVFWQVLWNSFVWDDTQLYLNEKNYPKSNRIENIGKFWVPGNQTMFAPVTFTTWAIISSAAHQDGLNEVSLNPMYFHLFNILIHTINGLLLFFILNLLFKNKHAGFAATLLFLFHPIQTEAVAWVSELRGLLSFMFGMLSVYFFIKMRNSTVKNSSAKLIILSILMTILSMLSKPSGIVFPFILFILDVIYFKTDYKKAIWYLGNYIPFVFVTSLISSSVESKSDFSFAAALWQKPFIFLDSIGFYLYKIFIPLGFSGNYGRTPQNVMNSSYIFLTVGVAIAILVFLLLNRKKYQFILAGYLIFIIGIIPVSGLANFYYQYFSTQSDRYIYISMFGLVLAVAYLLSQAGERKDVYAVGFIILFILGLLTNSQAQVWRNEMTLWDKAISNAAYPSSPSYLGRGEEYLKLGKSVEALADFTKATELDSTSALAWYNRGNVLLDMKRYQEAITVFTKSIKLNNKLPNSYVNRALAYSESHQSAEAISDYLNAIKLNPNQPDILSDIGVEYAKSHDYKSAAEYFRKALALNPGDENAKEYLERTNQLLNNEGKDK